MKIEITSRWSGAVLFSIEAGSMKLAVEAAVRSKTNLPGANLPGANLAGANLTGAYLTGAYLAGANLSDAYLAGANLAGANLAGAYLSDADLAGAYLPDANLTDAPIVGGFPDGWRAHAWKDKAGVIHVQVGCRSKTLSEARVYWSDRDNRREVVAFLDYVERVGKLRGWTTP